MGIEDPRVYRSGRLWANLSNTKRAAIGLGGIVLLGIVIVIFNSGSSNADRVMTSYASPTTSLPAP